MTLYQHMVTEEHILDEFEKRGLPLDTTMIPHGQSFEEYYKKGVIRKENLKDGQYYYGICRNAYVARWNKNLDKFEYMRYKFGWSYDVIEHPEDDDGYDIFLPLIEADENEITLKIKK